MDYLIGRNVNRMRDGIATRAFHFNPSFAELMTEQERSAALRHQRAALLNEVVAPGTKLMSHVNESGVRAWM